VESKDQKRFWLVMEEEMMAVELEDTIERD